MIIYFLFLAVSALGIFMLYRKYERDLAFIAADDKIRNKHFFAVAMNSIKDQTVAMWRMYVLNYTLRFTEKRLRVVRIIILKIERFLFRAAHAMHRIAEKHSNGNNGGNGDHTH